MRTDCLSSELRFQTVGRRDVVGKFDAGRVSSDGGALLLGELEERTGVIKHFSECFVDHRAPHRIEHSVEELVRQRVFGLCLGYEDLNDHDALRGDALLASAVGKKDPLGTTRRRLADRGHALAGKSTLNRLELTTPDASEASRYKKIVAQDERIRRFFVEPRPCTRRSTANVARWRTASKSSSWTCSVTAPAVRPHVRTSSAFG